MLEFERHLTGPAISLAQPMNCSRLIGTEGKSRRSGFGQQRASTLDKEATLEGCCFLSLGGLTGGSFVVSAVWPWKG